MLSCRLVSFHHRFASVPVAAAYLFLVRRIVMNSSGGVVVGIAWFRPDQWELLRSLSADAEVLEPTHAEWQKLARRTVRDLAGQGILARRVDVDVDRLQAWCKAQDRPLDASARAAYATERLRDDTESA